MTMKPGDRLPEGNVLRLGDHGPEQVRLADLTQGRVAVFGLPGAFTGTCTNAHMPSFVRSADKFRDKGVERILCLTVNDPFVADAWAKETGAKDAGIEVLADADGSVIRAMGLDFDAPAVGLIGRSKRFSALVRDGVVEVLNVEENAGQCSVSAGEALLEQA